MSLKFEPVELPNGSTVDLISVTSVLKLLERKELLAGGHPYKGTRGSSVGKDIHAIIKRINRGEVIKMPEWEKLLPSVQLGVMAYVRFKRETGYISRASEERVWSLKYGIVGTLDDRGLIKRYTTLCDWTTDFSKPLYKKLQVAVYRQLYLEMHPRRRMTGLRVVFLDKKTGGYQQEVLTEDEVKNLFYEFIAKKQEAGIF